VLGLDDIAERPRRVEELARPVVSALLLRCAIAQAALRAQLAALDSAPPAIEAAPIPVGDAWIKVERAAEIANLSPRWFYARANTPAFPFIRRLSRKMIRVDETALRHWLRATQ
jgi:hypothetical protein